MLTLFTTAKPFRGHSDVIQRNALQSWKALHRDVEIILFGDDEGAAEMAQEFGLRHEAHVERNRWGTKRLDYMFARAQVIARNEVLCYINCDILLMQDFWRAVERVRAMHREFLMVGRRWDVDIKEPLVFERQVLQSYERHSGEWRSQAPQSPDWQEDLRGLALRSGHQCKAEWIDYFAFTRGLYGADMPPFVLRVFWDNWLVWKALDAGKPVIDASRAVMAVHQNHDYNYHPQGKAGVWSGEECRRMAAPAHHRRRHGSAAARKAEAEHVAPLVRRKALCATSRAHAFLRRMAPRLVCPAQFHASLAPLPASLAA